MTIQEQILNLPNLLYAISKKETDALNELSSLYSFVFGENLKINCGDCRIRAYQKLINLDLSTIKNMENKKFKLKKDFTIYSKGKHFSHLTLPDNIASEYLKQNPSFVNQFDEYPQDQDGNLLFEETQKDDVSSESDSSDLTKTPANEESDVNSNDKRIGLSDEEKTSLYKKDGKFYLKKEDGKDEKVTQKFLKDSGVDLDTVIEA